MTRSALTADPIRIRCRSALAEHRRRARLDHQQLDYGLAELEALARSATTCAYCGNLIPPGTFTFDHKTPTSRVANYRLANVCVTCTRCNEIKGLLTADEFRQLLQLLRTWPPRAGNDVLNRLRAGGRRYSGRRRKPAGDCGT